VAGCKHQESHELQAHKDRALRISTFLRSLL